MTYRAPINNKQRPLGKMQSTQKLINIKIAKTYNAICFEASCVLAGVQPIGIEIEGKKCLYKRKHDKYTRAMNLLSFCLLRKGHILLCDHS